MKKERRRRLLIGSWVLSTNKLEERRKINKHEINLRNELMFLFYQVSVGSMNENEFPEYLLSNFFLSL
jgi:hypothetical protein